MTILLSLGKRLETLRQDKGETAGMEMENVIQQEAQSVLLQQLTLSCRMLRAAKMA